MELIWDRARRRHDLLKDPQVLKNNYVVEFDHPSIGKSMWPLTLLNYSETPTSNRKAAPALGGYTDELLTEILGYPWDEVVVLKNEGVIL